MVDIQYATAENRRGKKKEQKKRKKRKKERRNHRTKIYWHALFHRVAIISREKSDFREVQSLLTFQEKIYTVTQKKEDTIFLPVTSPNIVPIFKFLSSADSTINL